MNRYLILRENEQHGPFTLEEISSMELHSSDLVWVEGRSTAWNYPSDVPELSVLFRKNDHPENGNGESSPASGRVYVSLPLSSLPPNPFSEAEPEIRYEGSPDELKEIYRANLSRKKERNASGVSRSRVLLLSFMAGGLLLGALSLHSFLDPTYSGKSAFATKQKDASELFPEPNDYQTALRFEAIPKPDTLVEMKKATVIRPKSLRKMVLVKGSRYDVGLLGGIKDLQLTVSNKSAHAIEKATIAVDYLRPNGSLIRSERYTVQHLKGNASRMVDVPSYKRGVKVRYRVTEVQSEAYSDDLREL